MTKQQLRRLIDECCQRFDSVRARFAQDERRDPGDNSTRLSVCWWEALQDLELVDCLDVVREIFTGRIARPYPSDFPGTIASEIRKRKAERYTGSKDWADKLQEAKAEAKKAREADQQMETQFGAMLDAMPPEDQLSFAREVLDKYLFGRWEKYPKSLLVRQQLLEALSIRGRARRLQEATQ
jgi:hypothetical protein